MIIDVNEALCDESHPLIDSSPMMQEPAMHYENTESHQYEPDESNIW